MTQEEKYRQVIDYFQHSRPNPTSELSYSNTYQLLVAVILSAQCTDRRVNQVTPALFRAYPTPHDLAEATASDIYTYISSITYPNSKSRHLVDMARYLVAHHDGHVPATLPLLLTLPGVGRKTANVVAAIAFNIPAMPVDTHVFRVTNRIGLVPGCTTPLATERCLTAHIPNGLLTKAHHWFLLHGRYVCTARAPHCSSCGLAHLCGHYASHYITTHQK